MEGYNERRVRYYGLGAREYDRGWGGGWLEDEVERATFEEETEALGGELSPLPAGRVLDVACGTGVLTRFLHGEVVGLDGSEEMLRVARERVPSPDASPLAGEVLHLDPGSDGLHVVPPAPRPRPAAGHVAVEKVQHDPHGREPERPRPEPPRPSEPSRDGQEYRPFGDPHGYRLGPPGEHHAQFPAYLLSQAGPSMRPLSVHLFRARRPSVVHAAAPLALGSPPRS